MEGKIQFIIFTYNHTIMKYPEIKAFAAKLRKNATPAEKLLWKYLRNRQLDDRKFLRQHPIIYQNIKNNLDFFIPDFYCHEEKLVIELDGKIHLKTIERDKMRDNILSEFGLRVIRFKNEELEDLENVLERIRLEFDSEY